MKEMYDSLEFKAVKQAVSQNCSFSLGKEYILNEDVHFDFLWIQRQLDRGKEALSLYEVFRLPNFAGVKDISPLINNIEKGGIVNCHELYDIAAFSRACINMQKYMQQNEVKANNIKDLVDSLSIQKKIIEHIERCISNAYELKDNASSELKSIRRNIQQCESEISKSTQEFISKHASSLMDNIIATRNNRTCVLVKNSEKNKIKGFIHGESASGLAVYIEPEVLLRLNNKLQTLQGNEKEETIRILKELCMEVQAHTHTYLSELDTFALLDAVFAKAKWAFDHLGVYGSIEEKGDTLYFKDARHPLIDSKKVVANTYRIQTPNQHLLITGSNTGGKTVALKTIGLFTVLTLSGFPVLCEEAMIPCFDGIFVDIGDSQSIVESLSTFSAHLSKLAIICEKATSHSLVLIDELGSGTDPNEGECLAIAIIDYFRSKHIMSVATTHYSKLKEYAKKGENILLASMAFDMEKMQPTYQYLEGYSGQSNALEIAQRYHLNKTILDKAYLLKEEHKSDNERLMEKLDEDFMRMHQKEKELIERQKLLEEKENKLNKEAEKFTKEKDRFKLDAKMKANLIIESAKEEAEEVINKLKQLNSGVKEHEIIEIKAQLNNLNEQEEEDLKSFVFVVGDYVLLKNLGMHGEILSMKGNRATVFANGMKMNVKQGELQPTSRPKKKEVVSHFSRRSTHASLSIECNVIGLHVEEALELIDKYLDSALLSRMYNVRLVHGHGTGALRKAIHRYLKQNKSVKEFRLGQLGEGGMGATVVVLKSGEK